MQVLKFFAAYPSNRLPRFLRASAAPQDVGGSPGFEMFLDALADPDHTDHEERLRSWGHRRGTVAAMMACLTKAQRLKKK